MVLARRSGACGRPNRDGRAWGTHRRVVPRADRRGLPQEARHAAVLCATLRLVPTMIVAKVPKQNFQNPIAAEPKKRLAASS